MKKVPTPLEIAGIGILSILGLYMLYKGTTDQSVTVLIGGAVCFILSVFTLAFAIRNACWHRQMLRHSVANQKIDLEE